MPSLWTLFPDTFRIKRNAIDYTGDAVDVRSVDAWIAAAAERAGRVHAPLTTKIHEVIQ